MASPNVIEPMNIDVFDFHSCPTTHISNTPRVLSFLSVPPFFSLSCSPPLDQRPPWHFEVRASQTPEYCHLQLTSLSSQPNQQPPSSLCAQVHQHLFRQHQQSQPPKSHHHKMHRVPHLALPVNLDEKSHCLVKRRKRVLCNMPCTFFRRELSG